MNTTLTTCMALLTVCVVSVLFGLDSIFTFALPLMIGMISGLHTCCSSPPRCGSLGENFSGKAWHWQEEGQGIK